MMLGFRQSPVAMSRVFIVEDGKVLTFFRRRKHRKTGEIIEYYSFPGGEINPGETPEQAAIRETKEEMGVDIELGPKIAVQELDGFVNHGYSAKIIHGTPRLMPDSEEVFFSHKYNVYEVRWTSIDTLNPENLLYYAKFLPLIQSLDRGEIPAMPIELKDD